MGQVDVRIQAENLDQPKRNLDVQYALEVDQIIEPTTTFTATDVPTATPTNSLPFYRMRRRDFKGVDFDERDGFNHSTGGSQYFYLGSDDRYLSVGYRYDAENPNSGRVMSKQFSYDGDEVNTGLRWLWPLGISTFAGYAFRYEQYDGASADRRVNTQNTYRRPTASRPAPESSRTAAVRSRTAAVAGCRSGRSPTSANRSISRRAPPAAAKLASSSEVLPAHP